jgi:heme/copper-type cytochrome/quinol oxidase subunit 2
VSTVDGAGAVGGTYCASILVTVAENTPVTVNRTERVLTFMVASSLGLSVLAIIAIVIAGMAGVNTREGVWLTVLVLPPIGLIFGVIFIIAFVVVSAIRRSRAARDAAN